MEETLTLNLVSPIYQPEKQAVVRISYNPAAEHVSKQITIEC